MSQEKKQSEVYYAANIVVLAGVLFAQSVEEAIERQSTFSVISLPVVQENKHKTEKDEKGYAKVVGKHYVDVKLFKPATEVRELVAKVMGDAKRAEVIVLGRVSKSEYDNKATGKKEYKTEVIANTIVGRFDAEYWVLRTMTDMSFLLSKETREKVSLPKAEGNNGIGSAYAPADEQDAMNKTAQDKQFGTDEQPYSYSEDLPF